MTAIQPDPPGRVLEAVGAACVLTGAFGAVAALPFALVPGFFLHDWTSVVHRTLQALLLLGLPAALVGGGALMLRGSVRALGVTLGVTAACTTLLGWLAALAPTSPWPPVVIWVGRVLCALLGSAWFAVRWKRSPDPTRTRPAGVVPGMTHASPLHPSPRPCAPAFDRAAIGCLAAGMIGTLVVLPFALPLGGQYEGWWTVVDTAVRMLVLLSVPMTHLAGGVLMMRGSTPAAVVVLVVTAAGTVLTGYLAVASAAFSVLALFTGIGVVVTVLLCLALRPARTTRRQAPSTARSARA
jgi:hypothetical protein